MPADAQPETPWTGPTHSAPAPPRKPRRLGLWIPWGIAAVLAVGWSLWWLVAMHATVAAMDGAAAKLRAAGWHVSWAGRRTGGYPFRLDVDFSGLQVADPSGWAIATPLLKTEAYAFAPDHWVFFVPATLDVARPMDGAINVAARVLRGSISGWDQSPPRIALEGDDLTFTPAPGAAPLLLAGAHNIEAYTRPGPDDQGAAYLQIDGGQAAPGGWLAALAGGGPVSLKADVTFNHVSGFRGPGWRDALTAWSHGGGAIDLGHLTLTVGRQSFAAQSDAFTVGDDGRLAGQLALTAPQPLTLQFKQGGVWLGSAQVAPAPALF
jgi:hypothetical protein